MSAPAINPIERILTLAAELDKLGRTALPKAIEIGMLLKHCKETLPHGGFMSWVKERLEISHRSATNYMKLHDLSLAGKLANVANLNDAYRLISSAPKIATPPAPRPSAPRPAPAAVTIEAEIVEPPAPAIETEPIDDEPEPLVVDGTSDEIIEKENPWVTSRQAIAELAKLDGKISSPLGDVLAYIEKRWDLTFNLKVQKQ